MSHRADRILLAHGGGGELHDELLEEVILPRLGGGPRAGLDDSALLDVPAERIALTTDGYVVSPLFFPGGDIGRLAVSGTVNDLAVCGAAPIGLTLGMILEEGLPIETLTRILDSAAATAREAGVEVVAGDTKVVARGQADGVYLTTSGVGAVRPGADLTGARTGPGDAILVSGTIADHGLAVMLARESLTSIESELESDVAPLAGLVGALLDEVPDTVFLRDPTRGGLAGVLDDLAALAGRRVVVEEVRIPVRGAVRYAAEMLGIDPLSAANEGKVVAVVRKSDAERAVAALRKHPLGGDAAVIGRVESDGPAGAEMVTRGGGRRVVRKPYGEELPRIC